MSCETGPTSCLSQPIVPPGRTFERDEGYHSFHVLVPRYDSCRCVRMTTDDDEEFPLAWAGSLSGAFQVVACMVTDLHITSLSSAVCQRSCAVSVHTVNLLVVEMFLVNSRYWDLRLMLPHAISDA